MVWPVFLDSGPSPKGRPGMTAKFFRTLLELGTQVIAIRPSYSATGSQRKPSPQRLMCPTEGDGKCIVQHKVAVSQ